MRNDKSNISALDKSAHNEKWVAFVSKDWAQGETPVSIIIASSHCLEACNNQPAVLAALANNEVVINEFLTKSTVTELL